MKRNETILIILNQSSSTIIIIWIILWLKIKYGWTIKNLQEYKILLSQLFCPPFPPLPPTFFHWNNWRVFWLLDLLLLYIIIINPFCCMLLLKLIQNVWINVQEIFTILFNYKKTHHIWIIYKVIFPNEVNTYSMCYFNGFFFFSSSYLPLLFVVVCVLLLDQ